MALDSRQNLARTFSKNGSASRSRALTARNSARLELRGRVASAHSFFLSHALHERVDLAACERRLFAQLGDDRLYRGAFGEPCARASLERREIDLFVGAFLGSGDDQRDLAAPFTFAGRQLGDGGGRNFFVKFADFATK